MVKTARDPPFLLVRAVDMARSKGSNARSPSRALSDPQG
jgi:hypothetical protein